ncbi:hypothetical protein [Mycobacterium talmoniae]|uniref:Uncharacterized protein n=1 Tax=Mycobacterium talmoniae TaxID=1858794 RepID=A0A1S1NGT1_9MYCO|nr:MULTISPECIES: hypothetical protein [Mycobacterium]OHV01440.1 hypothetical protein BKN37_17035 [Mycobacterium talmoniae]PQM48308.1 hypothetical protein C1Y40_01480 [Mycobacterium talmoniae]TDH48190.1 hypothetical protein E2F47_24740 [Mycobacterium eburneum]
MTHQSPDVHADSALLRATLRIGGALVVVFFLTTPLATTGVIAHDSFLGRRVLWGHGGNEYLIMLAVINIVLGAYLFWSARNPSRYWLAIDIFLVAETVHLASMVVMALSPEHHMHWLGDVTGPVIGLIVLAAIWLPRRSAVIAAGNG